MPRPQFALVQTGYDPKVKAELDQLTATLQRAASTQGVWIDLTSSDTGLFTGSSLMTWTVEARDLDVRWTVVGDTLTLNLHVSGTTVGGTVSTALKMKLPANYTAKRNASAVCAIGDNSTTLVLGTLTATADSPFVSISRFDGANFTAATDATSVAGQIAIEVR